MHQLNEALADIGLSTERSDSDPGIETAGNSDEFCGNRDLKINDDMAKLVQFVAFSINGQDFCVDIMLVREIRAWDGASSLPNAPDYVRGVINLRGQIVPVIDLKARFGQGTTEPHKGAVIVVVMIGEKLHGLLVDSVSDILSVGPDDIAPAPEIISDEEASGLLTGIVKQDESMVAAIDLERLIA